MVHRMHAYCNTRICICRQSELGDECGMFGFTADGGTIFAIEGDIEDAGTEFLRHLRLQLQAFAHPRFNATVVIAYWDHDTRGLCP